MNIFNNRWVQLVLCSCVLFLISGPQYLWTLFVKGFLVKYQVPLSEIQITFSLLLVCMTFITPFAGFMHDRLNSKLLIAFGVVLTSCSWIFASGASSLEQLYLTYGIIGGLGTGISFIGCTGLIQKCFPDRRGLANGILSSAYAFGPLVSTYFISKDLDILGSENTLYKYGIFFLLIGLVIVIGLKSFDQIKSPFVLNQKELLGVSPKKMLQSKVFWLMFVMMCLVATCGMMIISNISIISKEFGISSTDIVMFGMTALPLALMFDRITNGVSRFLFGAISDKIGRENTLGIAFGLEALFILIWYTQLSHPVMFILFSGLVFLAWGEIYSIFPSLCTDTFGEKFASINYGFLFASAGIGSILGGPVAAYLREKNGSWDIVFYIIICLEITTAILAFTYLKTEREKFKLNQMLS